MTTMRILFGRAFLLASAVSGILLKPCVAAERPNFLVIIADDLGFSDPGCYGSEIATPNLDDLAANGLQYTQFYNTGRCWPTRSALLTGFYPQQIRRDGMPGAPSGFGSGGRRPVWAKTVAEYLSSVGYRNYHSGKWHVDGKPSDNGFDRSNETSRSHGFFDSIRRPNRDPKYYRTIATADHAIACLKEHAAQHASKPFFQYVAFHAPHFPLHALPEDIERYRARYAIGWDRLRQERNARQAKLNLATIGLSTLEPSVGPPYSFPDQIKLLGPGEINRPVPWDELTEAQKSFQATKMAIHAAMIDRMDQEIGRILEQLRTMGAFENTLILFLSDNGASAEMMVRGEGHDPGAPMGSAATYLCLGPGFSSASNTHFRRHKTWVHEGGISTPMIAHWPAGIEQSGELRSCVSHVIDIAPTLLDLADFDLAKIPGPPMAGISFKDSFAADRVSLRKELWFYHEGNRALRQENWKLIHSDEGREFPWARSKAAKEESDAASWMLYDLGQDRGEQNNVADTHPDLVLQMSRRWLELRDLFLKQATTSP